jgi:cysteine-rich repeat protein
VCGNGVRETGEQCDAGGANSNAANAPCRTNCQLPRCGDGIVDTTNGEQCDQGASNSNAPNATCRTTCQAQKCGDGIVDNTRGETCDDGNTANGDGCNSTCTGP